MVIILYDELRKEETAIWLRKREADGINGYG